MKMIFGRKWNKVMVLQNFIFHFQFDEFNFLLLSMWNFIRQ
jgi:hypothetical protein